MGQDKDKRFEHTFVIPCYGDSSFLKECIESLLCQTQESKILLTTATPSEYLKSIAEKYDIQLVENHQKPSIAGDWNFALSSCDTQYCTLAHQDDIYAPEYAKNILAAMRKTPQSLIAFCDYKELKNNSSRFWLVYLIVKRLLLFPFYLKHSWKSIWIKKLILSLGCPICCPSVTYNLNNLNNFQFSSEYTINLDWNAWLELATRKGAFIFVPKALMEHRIADECETAVGLSDNRRQNEDKIIFERLWPKSIASILIALYKSCYINSQGDS